MTQSYKAQCTVGEIWDRLDCLVWREYRQLLHREGDRSGRLLAWLLKQELPSPLILMLHRPDGTKAATQAGVNTVLFKHLSNMYRENPCHGVLVEEGYLLNVPLPRLTDEQRGGLEAAFQVGELQEALRGMAHHKSPGPGGLPVEFYHAYSEILLQAYWKHCRRQKNLEVCHNPCGRHR